MTRRIYESEFRTLGGGGMDAPIEPVTQRDVRYHLSAAVAVGGLLALAVAVGLLLLAAGLSAWLGWWWTFIPAAGVPLIVWAISTSLMGRRWIIRHITQPWDVDELERTRRHWYEDAAWEEAHQQAAPVNETGPRGEEMAKAMRTILDLHYVRGLAATRPECEREGISQPEWNTVNQVLKALKIKDERGWEQASSTTAYTLVSQRVTWTDDGRASVRVSADGQAPHYKLYG